MRNDSPVSTEQHKKTVLFIVTSFWAYGELTIALEFAKQLDTDRFKPLFLIPHSHANIVNSQGFAYMLLSQSGNINRCVMSELESLHKPALIVLADILNYNFCDRHFGITIDDLNLFSGKKGGFDLYDYSERKNKVDTYGNVSKEMQEVQLDFLDFLLQPAPILHPIPSKRANVFRYPLLDGNSLAREVRKENRDCSADKKEKMILITSAKWQIDRTFKIHRKYIEACIRAMEEIFLALPESVRVVSLGTQSLFLKRRHPNFIHEDSVPPDEFREIMATTDLIISNNFISTSMIRAVLRGIPTMLIQNSYLKRDGVKKWIGRDMPAEPKLLESCDIAYPFRVFPIGWFAFLQGIVRKNPFYRLPWIGELFEPSKTSETIVSILGERSVSNDIPRKQYMEQLNRLDKPNTILQHLTP